MKIKLAPELQKGDVIAHNHKKYPFVILEENLEKINEAQL